MIESDDEVDDVFQQPPPCVEPDLDTPASITRLDEIFSQTGANMAMFSETHRNPVTRQTMIRCQSPMSRKHRVDALPLKKGPEGQLLDNTLHNREFNGVFKSRSGTLYETMMDEPPPPNFNAAPQGNASHRLQRAMGVHAQGARRARVEVEQIVGPAQPQSTYGDDDTAMRQNVAMSVSELQRRDLYFSRNDAVLGTIDASREGYDGHNLKAPHSARVRTPELTNRHALSRAFDPQRPAVLGTENVSPTNHRSPTRPDARSRAASAPHASALILPRAPQVVVDPVGHRHDASRDAPGPGQDAMGRGERVMSAVSPARRRHSSHRAPVRVESPHAHMRANTAETRTQTRIDARAVDRDTSGGGGTVTGDHVSPALAVRAGVDSRSVERAEAMSHALPSVDVRPESVLRADLDSRRTMSAGDSGTTGGDLVATRVRPEVVLARDADSSCAERVGPASHMVCSARVRSTSTTTRAADSTSVDRVGSPNPGCSSVRIQPESILRAGVDSAPAERVGSAVSDLTTPRVHSETVLRPGADSCAEERVGSAVSDLTTPRVHSETVLRPGADSCAEERVGASNHDFELPRVQSDLSLRSGADSTVTDRSNQAIPHVPSVNVAPLSILRASADDVSLDVVGANVARYDGTLVASAILPRAIARTAAEMVYMRAHAASGGVDAAAVAGVPLHSRTQRDKLSDAPLVADNLPRAERTVSHVVLSADATPSDDASFRGIDVGRVVRASPTAPRVADGNPLDRPRSAPTGAGVIAQRIHARSQLANHDVTDVSIAHPPTSSQIGQMHATPALARPAQESTVVKDPATYGRDAHDALPAPRAASRDAMCLDARRDDGSSGRMESTCESAAIQPRASTVRPSAARSCVAPDTMSSLTTHLEFPPVPSAPHLRADMDATRATVTSRGGADISSGHIAARQEPVRNEAMKTPEQSPEICNPGGVGSVVATGAMPRAHVKPTTCDRGVVLTLPDPPPFDRANDRLRIETPLTPRSTSKASNSREISTPVRSDADASSPRTSLPMQHSSNRRIGDVSPRIAH